jgi:UDP-glucose 4-epimerase
MKILITGGGGYIGSVAVARTIEAGHEVVVLDNFFRGHRDVIPNDVRVFHADIRDVDSYRDALDGVDAVMHFAALSLVNESQQHPGRYWSVNVGGTQKLLDVMLNAGVTRLVFSSTAATYGEPREVPINETAVTNPTNVYGNTKLAVESMIGAYAAAHYFAAISLRYFNVAGSYGNLREHHEPETHLIPTILQRANTGQAIGIFGTDWPTPDGTAIRDYIHVVDLVDAHLLAIEAVEEGKHEIINLGSGTGYSVREVINAVEKMIGKEIVTREEPRRAGDPAVLIASNQRAWQRLGWRPTRSLSEMIEV